MIIIKTAPPARLRGVTLGAKCRNAGFASPDARFQLGRDPDRKKIARRDEIRAQKKRYALTANRAGREIGVFMKKSFEQNDKRTAN